MTTQRTMLFIVVAVLLAVTAGVVWSVLPRTASANSLVITGGDYHVWPGIAVDAGLDIGELLDVNRCLFPIVLSMDTFAYEPQGLPVIGEVYVLWVDDLLTSGNFGWAYWVDGDGNLRGEEPQGPQVTSLEANLLDTCRSGAWQAGEWVHGDNGVSFEPVLDLLEPYITADPPVTVTLPIYDVMQSEGTNSIFHLVDFGVFRLLCAHSSRAQYVGDCGPDSDKDNTKYLTGEFAGCR